MGEFVVTAFATLRKDVLVEAEDIDGACETVEQAFEDGGLGFTRSDIVADLNDYEAMTLEEAKRYDIIRGEGFERL